MSDDYRETERRSDHDLALMLRYGSGGIMDAHLRNCSGECDCFAMAKTMDAVAAQLDSTVGPVPGVFTGFPICGSKEEFDHWASRYAGQPENGGAE